MPRRDQLFETITAEGALLPSDFLQRLAQRDREIAGLTPDAYHLGGGEKLNEAISRSWNRLLGVWKSFAAAARTLPATDLGTTLTREKWLLPLFQELGYGRLQTAKPFEFDDRKYSISHGWQAAPIHLVSFRAGLDERSEAIVGARKSTPHSMVQEFLNRSDAHLWGMVSNGFKLRLLRDNSSLIRQAYVEFDLETMMEGEFYADFALLWLLLHQSRVEGERPELCWLEKWTQEARQQGERVLGHMRDGVQDAITALGQGFLAHPANTALRDRLRSGDLSTQDYFRQLLRVVYRLLFLCIAEDRDLLHPADVPAKTRENYRRHYSITRLRRMAQRLGGTQHSDLWFIVQLIVRSLGSKDGCPALGLPALGSFLWSEERATPALTGCQLSNRQLLDAIRSIAYTKQDGFRRPVDYKNIGSPEFGSVYESLLEQHPKINLDAATFTLDTHAGNERKTSGSHYTPPSLVNCLLDSALDPVLQERERDFAKLGFKSAEEGILSLKVCDMAVGSGHFLVAAAHRIAKRLASIRTGEEEPAPTALRHALRDVIGRCLYGVDINPMAVELCKFALWMEALEPGKPLSFLEHHIQCGNSLLGATPALMAQGIPDAAFEPIEGDDKKYCSQAKKSNREEVTQLQLLTLSDKPWDHLGNLATNIAKLASLPDDRLEDVQAKEKQYAELVRSTSYQFGHQLADAWCAAFVWKKCPTTAGGFDYPITNEIFRRLERNPHDAPKWMRDEIKRLAEQYQFFHWHLAFPDVFQVPPTGQKPENQLSGWNGGFDVTLGNPPWDIQEVKDNEFFANSFPEILAVKSAKDKAVILEKVQLLHTLLWRAYVEYVRLTHGQKHFYGNSGHHPLSGTGRLNLYRLFLEVNHTVTNPFGRVGIVMPSGFASDSFSQEHFNYLHGSGRLLSFFDFENRMGIFDDIHRSFKFCLATILGAGMKGKETDFVFFAQNVEELSDPERHVLLSENDLILLNPVTRTAPLFRSARDKQLALQLHRSGRILGDDSDISNWQVRVMLMFMMNSDMKQHCSAEELEKTGYELQGNCFTNVKDIWFPLYEGKMVAMFDHRAASIEFDPTNRVRRNQSLELTIVAHQDPFKMAQPLFWVSSALVAERSKAAVRWSLVIKDVTASTNERTAIAAILPSAGLTDSVPRLGSDHGANGMCCLLANLCSFALDFVARQKVAGLHLRGHYLAQLPVVSLLRFADKSPWNSSCSVQDFILPRVFELTYTAWDLETFAFDCGWGGPPFHWDEARRFLLRCELDAAFFHLYGLNRDDTAYILDTFPIVKRKDEAKFNGDYRTKRVILEIYDALAESQRTGQPYQTRLNPAPASLAVAHPWNWIGKPLELPTTPRMPLPENWQYVVNVMVELLWQAGGSLPWPMLRSTTDLLSDRKHLAHLAELHVGQVALDWLALNGDSFNATQRWDQLSGFATLARCAWFDRVVNLLLSCYRLRDMCFSRTSVLTLAWHSWPPASCQFNR